MSNKLVPVSRRELIKRLSKLGFVGPYPGADHEYMSRGLVETRIPNPHGSNISVDLYVFSSHLSNLKFATNCL